MTAGTRWLVGMLGIALLVLSGCDPGGFGPAGSGGNGAIAVSAVWPGQLGITGAAAPLSAQIVPETAPAGVGSLTAVVYDSNAVPVASGGPWLAAGDPACLTTPPCASISNVPAGGPYTVALDGWNGTGTLLYEGRSNPVTVSAGLTAPAGTVAMTSSHGGLDSTFNPTSGYNISGGSSTSGSRVLVDSTSGNPSSVGKIYVIGFSAARMAVWRYLPTGVLDSSWGASGVVTFDSVFFSSSIGYGGIITSDGLVVVGSVRSATPNGHCTGSTPPLDCAALWRYSLTDGAPDTTFGDSNAAEYAIHSGAGSAALGAVVIEDTASQTTPKKLLVAGVSNWSGTLQSMTLWRYDVTVVTRANRWDTTLCISGSCTIGYLTYTGLTGAGATTFAGALAMDGNKIVVVGAQFGVAGSCCTTLWRYNNVDSNGAWDDLGGGPGPTYFQVPHGGSSADSGFSIVVVGGTGGNYLIGGNQSAVPTGLLLWKFTNPAAGSAPTPDGTFNSGSTLYSAAGGTSAFATAMVTDTLGRVIAVGKSMTGGSPDSLTVWRFTSAGALDATFGIGTTGSNSPGYASVNSSGKTSGSDSGFGVAVDGSYNIYVTGQSELAGGAIFGEAIWKFRP